MKDKFKSSVRNRADRSRQWLLALRRWSRKAINETVVERSVFLVHANVMVGQGRMENSDLNLRHMAIQAVRGRVDPASGLRSARPGMTCEAF
jgi:hypothetical protein